MRSVLQILLILTTLECFAQPTGHQKLYLEVTDRKDTIQFENCFDRIERRRKLILIQNNYQLLDKSAEQTGFNFYERAEFIHKTLMTDDHHIQIVRNNTDTMDIEIFNAFNIYFLSITFKKGKFRLYINDGDLHKWYFNTLPYKTVNSEQLVYDITPADWSPFQVNSSNSDFDYFVSKHFEKQKLLLMPIIPEDDPNFRNPRRINNLRVEVADYNFDGQKDYREHKLKDTSKWNYFIYTDSTSGFVLDTLLSKLDYSHFDFEKKTFIGSKTARVNPKLTLMQIYEYINGEIKLVRKMECVHAFPNSERMDCSVYELENGKLVFKELIKGCE